MSFALNPIDHPSAWDIVTIAGVNSPLLKDGALDAVREYKWDVKEGKGTAGSTETFVGQPPAKFKLTFVLFTSQDFQVWDSIKTICKYDPTKKPSGALDIYHPALADIDIKAVVIEKIGAVKHVGQGEYNVDLDLLEYAPPPKASAVATPDKSDDTDPDEEGVGTQPPSAAQQFVTGTKDLSAQATSQAVTGAPGA